MQENFEVRIREIAKLKKGWSFGKGEPFSAEHVEVAALVALRYYKKYALTVSGTPSEDGSIDLMFNIKDVFLDLIILPSITDVTVKYTHGIGSNKIEEMWGTVSISKLDDIMDKLNRVYGVDIKVRNSNVMKLKYTGKFRYSDGIDYALRVMKMNIGFDYSYDENMDVIYIK